MKSPLIEKYGEDSRWVNWKLTPLDEKGKQTKIPYQINKQKAKTNDSSTWSTYSEVAEAYDNGSNGFSGVGIMLHDNKLVCIDIDHVVENGKVVHAQADTILSFLKKANSFTEISQSNTGLHVFLETDEPFIPVSNKKAPYEVYADVRYICTTDNSYDKHPKDIRTVTLDELEEILAIIGYPFNKQEEKETTIELLPKQYSDEYILSHMFKSKNGKDIEKLFNGDISDHDDDYSKAEMSLLANLAFWTGKDATQMERLWLSSPLGQREKTTKRKEYRTRSIKNAIANCKNIYVSPKEQELAKEGQSEFLVVAKKEGEPIVIPCQENVLIAMRISPELQGKFRYNIWLDKKETLLESDEWRAVRDNDYNLVKSILATIYSHMALITASQTFVVNAVIQYCEENSFDPAREYFESLVWDEIPRLDTWIKNTYNTVGNDEEYSIIGRQWLKALVKRVIVPACKFDNVLVLEGEQGIKKSTSLSVLGGDWHVELTTSPSDKDFFMLMKGHTIVEFSEGEIQERSSMKLLKSIITTQVDTYRSPYGREIEQHPRRCVFAMTTNDSNYLKDETGNRRWLPVSCNGMANVEWLEENKEQLYAEAYHRAITLEESLFEGLSTENIKDMQDQRREERVEESYIVDWYDTLPYSKKEVGVTIIDVYDGAIKRGELMINQFQKKIIGGILTNVLKLERKRDSKGTRQYKYFPTTKTFKIVSHGEEDLFSVPMMPSIDTMSDTTSHEDW